MAADPLAHGRSGRPPVRQQLSDKAAGYVRGLIMSGELRPGDGVRPETVGEALGISATPAREALQALRVEGFLIAVPRVGFVVSRAVGNAVTRNQVKRRLRHLMRERLDVLSPGTVLVVRALPPAAQAPYAALGVELDRALSRWASRAPMEAGSS